MQTMKDKMLLLLSMGFIVISFLTVSVMFPGVPIESKKPTCSACDCDKCTCCGGCCGKAKDK